MKRIAKWSVVPVFVVLLAAVGAGRAEAYRGPALVCGSSAGHIVIARNAQAEVYGLRERTSHAATYEYRGCVYGSKRSFQLGLEAVSCGPSGCFGVKHVTLAGTTVAYETELSSNAGNGEVIKSEWYVVVITLRTGRVLHKVPTGVPSGESEHLASKLIGAGETRAIVVKSDGAVAWINDTFHKEDRFEVHALDATGERVLAVGSNIAPESLALAGSTLYWAQGGKPFSAVLD